MLIFTQGAGLGLGDILLVGSLLEHAKYHSETYDDDFLTFLAEHYGSKHADHNTVHDHQDPHHKHLPFQHEHCNHSIAEVIVIAYEFPLAKPVFLKVPETNFYYLDLFSSFEEAPLFQPPRSA